MSKSLHNIVNPESDILFVESYANGDPTSVARQASIPNATSGESENTKSVSEAASVVESIAVSNPTQSTGSSNKSDTVSDDGQVVAAPMEVTYRASTAGNVIVEAQPLPAADVTGNTNAPEIGRKPSNGTAETEDSMEFDSRSSQNDIHPPVDINPVRIDPFSVQKSVADMFTKQSIVELLAKPTMRKKRSEYPIENIYPHSDIVEESALKHNLKAYQSLFSGQAQKTPVTHVPVEISPAAKKQNVLTDSNMEEDLLSGWEKDMIIKSVKLIAESRGKRSQDADQKTDSLPFARFATPEPPLEPLKKNLNANGADLDADEIKPVALESVKIQNSFHSLSSPKSSRRKQPLGSQTSSLNFKEIHDAERMLEYQEEQQVDASDFHFNVTGSRMQFESSTMGRGILNLGSHWISDPTALMLPKMLASAHQKANDELETSKGTKLKSIGPQILDPVFVTDMEQRGEEVEETLSVNDFKFVVERASTTDILGADNDSDLKNFTKQAADEWISPDAIVVPITFPTSASTNSNSQFHQSNVLNSDGAEDTIEALIKKNSSSEQGKAGGVPPEINIEEPQETDSLDLGADTRKRSSVRFEEGSNESLMSEKMQERKNSEATTDGDYEGEEFEGTVDESQIPGELVENGEPKQKLKGRLRKIVKNVVRRQTVVKLFRQGSPKKRRSTVGATDAVDVPLSSPRKTSEVTVVKSRSFSGRKPSESGAPSEGTPPTIRATAIPSEPRQSSSPERLKTPTMDDDLEIEDPTEFYAKQRRSTFAPTISPDGSIQPSSRPPAVIGVAVEVPQFDDKPTGTHSLSDKKDVVSNDMSSDSAFMAYKLMIQQAMQLNGFGKVDSPSIYQIVHDIERRKLGMNAVERCKFPVFDDPGPPLDITGTPILGVEGVDYTAPTADELSEEVSKLDHVIESSDTPIPANWRKRGMFLARIGKFNEAMDDFDRAIQFDPFNSDAYWHRHQLFLRSNEVESALRDLDNITENNKVHLGAFQTKARIYQALGIIKLAIVNYSAVIRLKPDNPDGFYNRACLFEAEGEYVYANEDFRMVRLLDPTNEHAITTFAMYSFKKQLWEDAINEFSKLIILNPDNATAFMLRGRAQASLARFDEALEDISTAISITPNKAEFFFQRGCLLRERNIPAAINDLSVSILLDESGSNSNAYYHRAKLYVKLGQHDLAVADYLVVTELDPTKARAFLNLANIYMRHSGELDKSMVCFNKSILIEPTHLESYLCRGELYQQLYSDTLAEIVEMNVKGGKSSRHGYRLEIASRYVDRAIKDYTRAIHISPSSYLLFLYRGRMLLKQGLMTEATMDFHAAFDLNSSIAQTFIQRALVLCFQRKYKQVIEEYELQKKKKKRIEDPALLLLIAKARISCGDYREALIDLKTAVEYTRRDPQIYLQRGICYENLQEWQPAIVEFSRCIVLMPAFAKAHYHRGLCKLYFGDDTGLTDLNSAVSLDEKFFEAYLTRASYYHSIGMYTNSIEDCNEALKLEPTSIRSHLLRGACKCKLNQFGLAITDFSKVINIDKTSVFAFYNRAIAYQLLNDLENAVKDYSIVLLIHEDSSAYRNRALIYWKMGDHENALFDLYAARDHFPSDSKLRGLLGLCLQKASRFNESISEFTAAVKLEPFQTETLLGRGNVYASMGSHKLARRDYARVIHMYPYNTEGYVNIGYSFQGDNKPFQAWEAFTQALTIDKRCTAALDGRAIVNLVMKNPFASLMDLSVAIEMEPKNAELLTNRGVVFEALNDHVSAMQSYKVAIQSDETYTLAYFNAGNLYLRQALWDHAISYFNKVSVSF